MLICSVNKPKDMSPIGEETRTVVWVTGEEVGSQFPCWAWPWPTPAHLPQATDLKPMALMAFPARGGSESLQKFPGQGHLLISLTLGASAPWGARAQMSEGKSVRAPLGV